MQVQNNIVNWEEMQVNLKLKPTSSEGCYVEFAHLEWLITVRHEMLQDYLHASHLKRQNNTSYLLKMCKN